MKGCKTIEAIQVLGAINGLRRRAQAVVFDAKLGPGTPTSYVQALDDSLRAVDKVLGPLEEMKTYGK